LVDAEVMLGFLKRSGFEIINNPAAADVAIVNTCAFIKEAKQEAIEVIFDLIKLKKKSGLKKIIVSGCLYNRYRRELPSLLFEVDGFLGPGSIDRIAQIINNSLKRPYADKSRKRHYLPVSNTPRISLTPRHYAYVKISDGCNNLCSYCVIPQIRGRFHSRPIPSIVKEVKNLASKGVKEINLISQDTTLYGRDIYNKLALKELLKKLVKIKKIKWIRLLYMHPRRLKGDLLKFIRDEQKICKYIDLPIQHINDKILKLMNRKVNSFRLLRLIDTIRKTIPEAALRTTLIVGFPQETDKIFSELYDFIRETRFEHLGVFTYSPEENTAAALLAKQVPERIKKQRRKKIMLLQQEIVTAKHNAMLGKKIKVLIDATLKNNFYLGRSQFDAPEVDGLVYVKGKDLAPGNFANVRITENMIYDLSGVKA